MRTEQHSSYMGSVYTTNDKISTMKTRTLTKYENYATTEESE
jgi:hypothetical protein